MNSRILILLYALLGSPEIFAADEIHWTFTGQTSVSFDWRGTEDTISFRPATGTPPSYTTINAYPPSPLPTSSSGPFWEAQITGLQPDSLYYYSIGNGPEHTFITPPLPGNSDFIVYVEGDIGSTSKPSYKNNITAVQQIIGNVYGNGFPDFSLLVGDLSYADINGTANVDQHFNDVMSWSQDAAYMPAWGNHEWNTQATLLDHLNNYEGRFDLPNSFTSPGADSAIGNGPAEDWYWFDYGNVRFIAYPEPYPGAWSDWNAKVKPVMDAAQQNPNINFIVTFGHRPAYASDTPGEDSLKNYLDVLALLYSKYVLNLSGHHHDYERTDPSQTNGVTHVVAGTGHTPIDTYTTIQPPWSVFRAIQPGALKLHFTNTYIKGEFICAPASSVCSTAGTVLDSFTIVPPPPTVNFTAPAAGATVSGIIALSATASDNVAVAGVQFILDGINLGSEDTTAPYSISWDTTTAPAGGHLLTALARDIAGNITSSNPVSVTVNNAAPWTGVTNLSHQWRFDDASGSSALDSVGINNAALSNSSWVTGKLGNAAAFNGANASGDAGKIDFGTGNFTVAHWVNVSVFKNYAAIFNNRSSASGNVGFQTRTDGAGTIKALISFGATSKNLAVTNAVTGNWYHIAVSVDRAGLMKLYVNGTIAGQTDISSFRTTSITNTDNVRIGRDQASNYFNGAIDDLRLYNTVLSAADIVNIYNEPLNNFVPVDSTAPAVSIATPASDTTVSGTISTSANASDNVGVAGVQFKLDGVNLGGEDTTAPYSISWDTTTALDGVHTLTALARDAAGNISTSSTVSVTVHNPVVDAIPPTVSMTAPIAGAAVSGVVSLSATASDNIGVVGVQFKLDLANLGGEVSTVTLPSDYLGAWDTTTVTNGVYTLTAVARDAAGNMTTSSAVSVTVDNLDTTPPTVSIMAPASGTSVSGAIPLSATASDNVGVVGVQFKLDLVNLGGEVTTVTLPLDYLSSWDTTTVANGVYALTAVARDAAGNATTSSAVSVTVNNITPPNKTDTSPPTVGMTAPITGAVVSGAIPLSATASDNVDVVGVQFKLDGNNLGGEVSTVTSPSDYVSSWDTTTVANGVYALTAVARDAAGNMTTSSVVSVTVNNLDTTPPTVSITAPASGATVSGGIPLSATASDNIGVVGVQFKLDGNNLGGEVSTVTSPSDYVSSWDTTTVVNGVYALTAVARDASGNISTSSTVSVTVNNPVVDVTPPSVSMTAPIASATVSGSISLSANASDNVGVVGVQFKLDGNNLGGEDTAAPYSISWDTTTAADGSHLLTALARDIAGNITSSSPVSVTVNNAAPASTVTNLTHQWKFDETSGSSALDSVGINNAALNNASWVTGKLGNAATFNGANASGDAGKIDFGAGNFTVAHWVNVNGFKNYAAIFNNRSSASGNIGFQTRTDGTSTIKAFISFGATTKNLAVTNAVAGNWYHIAVSVDRAGLMKLYVNGAVIGQTDISAFSTTSITNTDNVRIGRDQAANYFNGAIDDLRLYNKALSATDILNIYNETVNNTVPVDATAPSVNIATPASGANLSGTISISATASDNVGVAGVQFALDGSNLGSEDTTAPYSISWDTTTALDGVHTLTALARDAAGNVASSSPVSVTVNNAVPSPSVTNLTHQWRFDEISGSSALDAVGANNVTLTNASWVTGKSGNAAAFNGANASGDAGKIDFGAGNFTLAHWVNVSAFKNYAAIFNNRSSSSGNIGFQTRTDGANTIKAFISFGATTKNLAITNAVAGNWYHVAVSVDRAGLMKLYINGVIAGQVDISAFSAVSITNADNARIGRDQASNYFNGAIDDLRLYNTALSATDIAAIYSQ